jgi:uncharacterized protein (TIRG00374 family)
VRRKWLSIAVKYGIGLGLLGYMLYANWEPGEGRIGIKAALFRPNRWEYFPLALLCYAVLVSQTFVRWHMLVRAQGLPFSLRDAFRLGLVGNYFNTFLPGSVGGDLLKAAVIAREQQRRTVAVSTVLIDRGVGLWGLIALAAIVGGIFWALGDPAITAQADLMRAVQLAIALMVISLSVFLLLGLLPERRAQRFAQRLHAIPRAGKILAEFWRAIWIYRVRGLSIIKALVMAITGHVFTVLGFYFAAMTFQAADEPIQLPDFLQHFVIVPVGMTFQGFFPSPGGIGGGEFIFELLYRRLGAPKDSGLLASLGFRMCAWLLAIIGAVVYQFMKRDLQAALPGQEHHSKTDSILPDGKSSTTQER